MPSYTCVYFNCYKNYKFFRELSFFKFPVKDRERAEIWRRNCGNPAMTDVPLDKLSNKLICEDHFSPVYICQNNRRKMLRANAIPIHFEAFEMDPLIVKEESLSDREYSPPSPDTMRINTPLRTYVNKRFANLTSRKNGPNFSGENEVSINEIKQEPCDPLADPIKVLPPLDFNHSSINVGNGIRLFPITNSGEHSKVITRPSVAMATQNGAIVQEIKEEIEPGVINYIPVPPKRLPMKFISPCQYDRLKEKYEKLKHRNRNLQTQIWRLKKRPNFNQTLYQTLDTKPAAVKTFILMQLIHRKATAWTGPEKQLALSLFHKSSSTYKFMVKKLGFVLPAGKTISYWRKQSKDAAVEEGQEQDSAEQNNSSDGMEEEQEQHNPFETAEERQQDTAKEDEI